MNSVYIYHHLGLGDHIIANGLVRSIAKEYDNVFLFCLPHNVLNVHLMYKDLKNLRLIALTDKEVKSFIFVNPNNNYIITGHNEFTKIYKNTNNTLKLDEIFYKLANIPIENKWKEFYIERDLEKEKGIYYDTL